MKTRNCSIFSALLMLVLAGAMVPSAFAQCGFNRNYKPAAWHPQIGSTHFMHAALFDNDDDDSPSIVGMWHVTFTAHTVNGNPIPSNAYPMIDNAIVVWHQDRTEIMNSARPPQDGNFCLGVWKKTGATSPGSVTTQQMRRAESAILRAPRKSRRACFSAKTAITIQETSHWWPITSTKASPSPSLVSWPRRASPLQPRPLVCSDPGFIFSPPAPS